MSRLMTVSYEGKPCYDIVLEQDFHGLPIKLQEIGCQPDQKICIVTDSNLSTLHLQALSEVLRSYFDFTTSFVFPAGEAHKNLDTVNKLYQELISMHFDRHDLLIAFGGGVVGDLTGFTAATYLRGIGFIQIPTSLLAQVDSSIGGKTGVDVSQYKNMVGAFYQPKLVYMNLSLLQTLPKQQFISGMGEVLKHGLIKSKPYFTWLAKQADGIQTLQPELIEEMVYQSCLIKRDVVERDPKEKGERMLLNFGHTIGHSVEKLLDFKLYHGQCVAIGMAAACQLSCDCGQLTKEERQEICDTLRKYGLPTQTEDLSAAMVLDASKSDKKMIAGKINFVLLASIGHAYICSDLNDGQLLTGISSILKE